MCPGEETGAGLAPACWPDQKPVRLLGVTRHSVAASGLYPQTGTGEVPQAGLEVDGCSQMNWTSLLVSTRTVIGTRSLSLRCAAAWSSTRGACSQTAAGTQRRCGLLSVMQWGDARSPSRVRAPTAPA